MGTHEVSARPTGGVPLPAEEYARRWSAAQAEARERGLDALVVWSKGGGSLDSHWDVFYLSGFYSPFPWFPDHPPLWSGRSFAAIVLPVEGDPTLVLDIPDWRRDLVGVEDVRFSVTVVETVASVLRERKLDRGRLGLVGTYTLPVGMYQNLIGATSGAEYIPANDVLEDIQVIKSPVELDLMREAAQVGSAMVEAIMNAALRPGVTEAEAVAAGRQVGARMGAAMLQTATASGPHSHCYAYGSIPCWTSRVLEEGDLFHIDNFGLVNGYLYDFGRGLVVGGRPTAEQREILEAGIEAVDAGVDAIRPGVKASAVNEVVESVLRERDMIGDGGELSTPALRLSLDGHGHGIGCGWGWPYVYDGEQRTFEAGMCIAIETMAGRPHAGSTYYEQNVIVHEDRNEILTTAPKRYW